MKKVIIISCILFSIMSKVYAADWVQVDEIWYVDLDSIETNDSIVSISTRLDTSKQNLKLNNKKIYWVDSCQKFTKNKNYYITTKHVAYNRKKEIIEEIEYPNGKTYEEYPNGCVFNVIKDISILNKTRINDIKIIMEMGMIQYFSPYVDVYNPNEHSPEENKQEEKKFKELLENVDKGE